MSSDLDKLQGAAIASLVINGDVSALSETDQARYYLFLCNRYNLDPNLKPFDRLKLNGKTIFYMNRGATDSLARQQRIQRITVQLPQLVSLDSFKIVVCRARATEPNGRYEERVATSAFTDPANVFMKTETKAHRRATLAVLGMGLLDESELDFNRTLNQSAEPVRLQANYPAEAVSRAVQSILSNPTLQLAPGQAEELKQARLDEWKREVKVLSVEAEVSLKEAHRLLKEAITKAREAK